MPRAVNYRAHTVFARSRGQVLLVAVMVLFGVATLAALFVGLLGSHMAQVTRASEVTDLREMAAGGLAQANQELQFGVHGADWRPSTRPLPMGKGQVVLRVSYGPSPGDLQSRYLLISATATFPDNPFASYSILGVKPLVLTDYARCITDLHELRQPAALGVTGVEAVGQPRADYLFQVNGPIFSNTDLVWYGNSEVNLTSGDSDVLRDDRIEVAGQMRSGALLGGVQADDEAALKAQPLRLNVNGVPYADNVFFPGNDVFSYRYNNGFPDLTPPWPPYFPLPNTCRVLADLPTFGLLTGRAYSLPRLQPPRMDAVDPDLNTNRYLTLTKDSGEWFLKDNVYRNRGEFGFGWAYGGGIYLDNGTDLQYKHDLDRLRQNWILGAAGTDSRPSATTASDWWDKTGRYYAPPGAEIILHGEADCPYIEIIRDDPTLLPDPDYPDDPTKKLPYYWEYPIDDAAVPSTYKAGDPIPATGAPYAYQSAGTKCAPGGPAGQPAFGVDGRSAIFPFPPNGVLYAEGNVRVRGVMPYVLRHPSATMPYFSTTDWVPEMPTARRSRKYDLQIVSGGTIYIEGDLLSAKGAKLYTPELGQTASEADIARWDLLKGSRVALIARDSVCLNTTALNPRPVKLYVRDEKGAYVDKTTFNDGQGLYPDPPQGYPWDTMFFQGATDDATNEHANATGGLLPDGYYPTYARSTAPPDPTLTSTDFLYTNVRLTIPQLAAGLTPDNLKLILGHSAWYRKDETGAFAEVPTPPPARVAEAAVRVSLQLNNPLLSAREWPWPGGKSFYQFSVTDEPNLEASISNHWYLENQWYSDPATRTPFTPDNGRVNDFLEWSVLPGGEEGQLFFTGQDRFTITPTIHAVWNEDTDNPQWIVKPKQLGYVLGPLAVTPPRGELPLPVRIEALVYAQNGSWYVLPGPWFNENPADRVDDLAKAGDYSSPVYHEPLNLQIEFYGAITENMPAPLGDVAEWTSKWAGLLVSGTVPAEQRRGLVYWYDPLLRQTRTEYVEGAPYTRPRFPNLPLSPDLVIWGERVAGYGGAGI